jgi:nicotinate phosphoribosyltransferase
MRHDSGLLTDLYELTMAMGYLQTGLAAEATFELFVRHLPRQRNYLIAAGLEEALDYLEKIRFAADEIEYLRRHPAFRHVQRQYFDRLAEFRFTGDVWAMPEGTLVFAGEPILRVTAPIAEAQIVETYLLAAIHCQTLIASKAARVVRAARGRPVVEFGTRRAHGIEAGVFAARAAYLGGCAGTSNTYAGHMFGIPTFGTQAHSWIMAHEDEQEAFSRFLDVFPEKATLLVDTYDVRRAVEKIIALGRKPAGIRLDSGNLVQDSRWVRRRLAAVGWKDVQIFASGDLNEDRIAKLLRQRADVDAFGVGTALATSSDAPNIGMIYKLVEVRQDERRREAAKFSPAKATYPGKKQVFRRSDRRGRFTGDVLGLEDEQEAGEPLLAPVLRAGKRIAPATPLAQARAHCLEQLRRLPERYHRFEPMPRGRGYPVRLSAGLKKLFEQMRRGQEGPRRG